MNVHIVNVIAYHSEFALEKYGKQIPMSLYSRYGATSNNGGMVPSIARNQPQAKPQTTCNNFQSQNTDASFLLCLFVCFTLELTLL